MATTPQDRKPKKTAQADPAPLTFDDIEGHELLVPLSSVKGSDQMRLASRFTALGILPDEDFDEAALAQVFLC